jgi:hypothetical protein
MCPVQDSSYRNHETGVGVLSDGRTAEILFHSQGNLNKKVMDKVGRGTDCYAELWIRIRQIRHHFAESGSASIAFANCLFSSVIFRN